MQRLIVNDVLALGARAVEELPRDAARAGDGHAQQGVRTRHRLHVPPAQQLLKGLGGPC